MLFSFAKFGCVLFSENEDLNPLKSYLPPQLIEVLQNFVEFRYFMVTKAGMHKNSRFVFIDKIDGKLL
jgi:hypothetical protein